MLAVASKSVATVNTHALLQLLWRRVQTLSDVEAAHFGVSGGVSERAASVEVENRVRLWEVSFA